MERSFFDGKRVLVMGLGRFGGGLDAAVFAHNAGAKVTVTDTASQYKLKDPLGKLKDFEGIRYHLAGHRQEDFEQADIIIVNPAVRPDNRFIETARKCNRFVTSATNIFFELCPAAIIGITGSNGKSTTAALTAHLLKNHGNRNVYLSGNIGNRPLLALLDKIRSDDIVVLELSSFQLEQLAQIKKSPQLALLTNLTANHLDRHGSFEAYCAAKENIFRYQDTAGSCPAVSIFNGEDEIANQWYEKYRPQQGRICIRYDCRDVPEDMRKVFTLPGTVNLSNLAGAIAIARRFDITDEAIKQCLPDFKALPHRLELVLQAKGIKWYNDSIATTPQSTMAALEAFAQPIVLIAGGYDKGVAFDQLGRRIADRAKAVILIGQTALEIADSIKESSGGHLTADKDMKIVFAQSLAEAVEFADKLAVRGDIILLSPACASYDMFDNFQQRGEEFTALAARLT